MKPREIKQIFVMAHRVLRVFIKIIFILLKNFRQANSERRVKENRHYRNAVIFHQSIKFKEELLRTFQRKSRDNKRTFSIVIVFNRLF